MIMQLSFNFPCNGFMIGKSYYLWKTDRLMKFDFNIYVNLC